MLEYDPFSPEVLNDPYPIYRRLREEAPVYHIEAYDSYALSRFEDIWDTSNDSERFTVEQGTSAPQLLSKVLPVFPNLNHMDPPHHTDLRKRIAHFFTPRAVEAFEQPIRSFFRERLEEVLAEGRCDVVGDLAFPVSARVACIAMGFPLPDIPDLIDLVRRFFRREPGVVGMTSDGIEAYEAMQTYVQDLTRERRARGVEADNPVDTLIGVNEIAGSEPPEDIRASHLMLLLLGSTETFPKTFASALFRLWQHPDQLAEVRADPGLLPGAFDEVLRYDMPTQFLGRTTLCDVSLHGVTIPAGRPVLLLYPSGNRDDREFERPDEFDIHRCPSRIVTFGQGVHRCMGVHFAKLEGRILLEEILQALADYTVDEGAIERERTEFVQGFTRLPIEFQAR
ncbi:cytochrome P450 [Myxococcota bacterium]|nr:cytochrome P450 [Myxococcota bacterium]